MTDYSKLAIKKHLELHGKIGIELKDKLDTRNKLSTYYTPGVGAVSSYVAEHPDEARDYTWLNNNVAVISDGSAVLGLGDIGPLGALPVMEGKAMLFKHFAGIDAVPIVLDVHSEDEIVAAVKAIAPSFGAINLEDIAAPICFNVETRLINDLNIPVFHDDQHGTAIVVLAGLINACKVTNKELAKSKIVLIGSGAAGIAITKLIHLYAPSADLILVDSKGIISSSRPDLNVSKKEILKITNLNDVSGGLKDAIKNADIFIGVSKPELLTTAHIKSMSIDPIILAMANPIPEIMPDIAYKAGAAVVATGRSDFNNQVNNALAFPGIFRGALDQRLKKITNKHKIRVAEVIASLISNPTKDEIIPSVLDERLVPSISKVFKDKSLS